MLINEAEIVLCLRIQVEERNRKRFLEFCRNAFPVYESVGGCKMVLYEDTEIPGSFNEIGYYREIEDYQRSEYATIHDPAQSALIKQWRALLARPPKVMIYHRITI